MKIVKSTTNSLQRTRIISEIKWQEAETKHEAFFLHHTSTTNEKSEDIDFPYTRMDRMNLSYASSSSLFFLLFSVSFLILGNKSRENRIKVLKKVYVLVVLSKRKSIARNIFSQWMILCDNFFRSRHKSNNLENYDLKLV